MNILTIMSFLDKYKIPVFIVAMLVSLFILIQHVGVLKDQVEQRDAQIVLLKDKHKTYIEQQKQLIAEQKKQAKQQERIWNDKVAKAKEDYNVKIKTLKTDNVVLERNANSLSKQLAESRKQLSTATNDSIRSYTATLTNVFEQCVKEYRDVAKRADEHAIEANTLKDSIPAQQPQQQP